MTGIRRTLFVAVACILLAAAGQPARADTGAEAHIVKLMMGMFDKPEQRLSVGPIAVAADHAIAGWAQGDTGGRALLRRKGHEWQIVLCSGDQLKSADTLTKVGLPPDAARTLAARLAEAEKKVDPARLATFAKFDGIVMIEGGAHPPAHGHGAPHGQHPPAHPVPHGQHKPHGH